jgi:hypothetical protein
MSSRRGKRVAHSVGIAARAGSRAETPPPQIAPSPGGRWHYLPCPLVAAPVLLASWCVYVYSVNIAWEDQFFMLTPMFGKWSQGNLHLADFWAQHNEHRHLLPQLAMFAIGLATKWNTKVELWLVLVLLAVNLAIVLAALARACHVPWRYWLAIPPAWLVFSLRQHQNLLCGIQLCFVMAAMAAMAALALLAAMQNGRRQWWKFSAAALTATVGTLSSAHGLLLWPVGLLPLAVLREPWRRRAVFAATWLFVGALQWAFYFAGYHKTVHPVPEVRARTLANCSEYFLTVVGGALFPDFALAKWGGVFLLAIAAIALALAAARRRLPQCAFWLALAAFGLAAQAEVAWGRTPFGSGQALSSRYATFSLFLVLGVYGVLATLLAERAGRLVTTAGAALLMLIAWGVALSCGEGVLAAAELKTRMEYHAFVFLTADTQPDDALRFAPWEKAGELRHDLAVLKALRLNVFASPDAAARYAVPPIAAMRTTSETARVEFGMSFVRGSRDMLLVLAGYALSPAGDDRAGGVVLEIDATPYRAYYGLPADSLPEVRKDPSLRECGFRRAFSRQQLPTGTHTLAVRVLAEDGTSYFASGPPQAFQVPQWPK